MQQAISAAVNIRPRDNLVAALQQHRRRVSGRHASSKRQCTTTSFERCESRLESFARWIAATRVIEFAPLASFRLNKCRGDMDWWNHSARLGIGGVANVNSSCAKLHRDLAME